MLSAHRLGMTRGEFTFLDVEIFQSSYWGDHYWELGDEDDQTARKAYEALLRVSLLQPTSPSYQIFADQVRIRAKRDYNYTFVEDEEVNFFIGAFFDGVYLLGMALNETLTEGGNIRDGTAITRKMWNRSFDGEYSVYIFVGRKAIDGYWRCTEYWKQRFFFGCLYGLNIKTK